MYCYAGSIQCSCTIMPLSVSEKSKQGDGRSDPNNDPYCPPPVGRLSFSLNPFKMLGQLVGDDIIVKLYMTCGAACCCYLVIMMFPMIFSNIVASMVTAIF